MLQPMYDADRPIKVYLLMGQSNAVGKALTYELPELVLQQADAVGSRVQIESLSFSLSQQNSTLDNYVATPEEADIPANDPRAEAGTYTLGELARGGRFCMFGPDLSIGIHLAEAMKGSRIHIFKLGYDGADLQMVTHQMYPAFLPALAKLRRDSGVNGGLANVEMGGVFWVHGEADAKSKDLGSYGMRLASFVRQVRSETAEFNSRGANFSSPFVTVMMRPKYFHHTGWPSWTGADFHQANTALAWATQEVGRASIIPDTNESPSLPRYFDGPMHCVTPEHQQCMGKAYAFWKAYGNLCEPSKAPNCSSDSDAFPTAVGDDLHFTAKGQMVLGIKMASAVLEIEDEGSPQARQETTVD